MNNIGKRIRKFRRENNLTQEKLAEAVGVTYQSVSKNGVRNLNIRILQYIQSMQCFHFPKRVKSCWS